MSNSDIIVNTKAFDPEKASPSTKALNAYLLQHANDEGPKWWDIGAETYRKLQDEGKTSWPAPAKLEHGKYISIPSRQSGRDIKCRLLQPKVGTSRGVFIYIHGGGHVLGHADWQDALLDSIANATKLSVISIEYRLAPEHPFPAGPEDCFDVAEYLVDNATLMYGGPLKVIGGESAGSSLTAHTTLHLLDTRPNFALAGVILNYGIFDLSLLPCARTWTNPLIMTTENINHFYDAYLPNKSPDDRRDPAISPMYHPIFQYPGSQHVTAAKYQGKRPQLPPALFLCGTQDAVLDDQVLMSFKWQIGGGEARIKFIDGAPHAFLLLDANQFNITAEGRDLMIDFILEKI